MNFIVNDLTDTSVEILSKQYSDFILLQKENWNDWWRYKTTFSVSRVKDGKTFWIGNIKIGYMDVDSSIYDKDDKLMLTPNIPESFTNLNPNFFSLGQDVDYYKELLNQFPEEDERFEVLEGLGDIAYSLDLYEQVKHKKVTYKSIFRNVSPKSVSGEFNRLIHGVRRRSEYSFSFKPSNNNSNSKLFIDVKNKTAPPTNIHALIGRNGVGKTYLMKELINSLVNTENSEAEFSYKQDSEIWENDQFANLVAVSFSAFDNGYKEILESLPNVGEKYNFNHGIIKFEVIGWNSNNKKKASMVDNSAELFLTSLNEVVASGKTVRWKNTVEKLYTDPMFKNAEVSSLISKVQEDSEYVIEAFKKLSSGHKIVLLTLTSLIEKVEEKTLVLIDEPELHLHPPLLSTFIRTLSELLINRNAVAILATHSPVILQELPSSCVSMLNRFSNSKNINFLKPDIETFGNNVGTLTSTVFELEAVTSGYYSILKKLAREYNDFDDVLNSLNGQLASEGQSVLLSLLFDEERMD